MIEILGENENIVFENRAWEEAKYPNLCMKEPEKFKYTEIENFIPREREVHLTIDFHRGRKRWCLNIYYNNNTGELKLFDSVKQIVEYIKKAYKKSSIIPEKWL